MHDSVMNDCLLRDCIRCVVCLIQLASYLCFVCMVLILSLIVGGAVALFSFPKVLHRGRWQWWCSGRRGRGRRGRGRRSSSSEQTIELHLCRIN